MRPFVFFFGALLFPSVAQADWDFERVPKDFRMSVHVGGGYTWMAEGPAFALGLEYGFDGGKASDDVRIEWMLGLHYIAGTTLKVFLPNDTGAIEPWDFPRDSVMFPWGPGIRFGKGDSFMLSIRAFVGPVLSQRPGTKKDESITTVGAGFGGCFEIHPFYIDLGDRAHSGEHPTFGEWIGSAVSVWGVARMEWVGLERGPSLTAGIGIDMLRAIVGPLTNRR